MILPKAKSKKLIKKTDFTKVAEKVKKSFEDELKYLLEKRLKNGDNISPHTYSLS